MQINDMTFDDEAFSQPDAVRLTRPSAATLDNWLRFDHVRTVREGSRRVFAFKDLLQIDCIENLTTIFKMPPAIAASFARRAVEQYRPGFEIDVSDIARGTPWSRAPRDLDSHFSFVRTGEAVEEVQPGEDRPDSVMLVLPTRMIARRLIEAIHSEEQNG